MPDSLFYKYIVTYTVTLEAKLRVPILVIQEPRCHYDIYLTNTSVSDGKRLYRHTIMNWSVSQSYFPRENSNIPSLPFDINH